MDGGDVKEHARRPDGAGEDAPGPLTIVGRARASGIWTEKVDSG